LWYKGSGNSGLTNEIGSAFWKCFGGATITYGNLCWPAGLEAVRLTMGSVKHNVPWDIVNACTIIIWGKNPAETNIQEMAFIEAARERGCRVIVIDLRRTPTADKADMLICPRPGTDAALALGIASVLVNENLIDTGFIGSNVIGFDKYMVKSLIIPENASDITGIPVQVIIELAHTIAKNSPLTILPGYGLQRHSNGGQTIRSILSLAIITGNIGKPGAGFNYANLQGYVFDRLKEPVSYYPDPATDFPFRRSVSMAGLGRDMMNLTNPVLKAAWIERGNPLIQSPDSENVRKAFSKLEFRIVVDQFMTDTAEIADIILPAKDIFEQADIISSYWSPYVQFKPAILESQGEVIPESEIYYHLAVKLGMNIDKKLIPEPGNENIERWLDERIRGYSGLTLDDLRKRPVLAPGLEDIAYKDLKFETPSGKIELFSEQASLNWRISPLPEFNPIILTDEQKKYPLLLITPNTGSRIHSQFGNMKIIMEVVPAQSLEISPDDASERGISTGDIVRVFNERGEFKTPVSITGRVPRGIAVMPNGIWLNEGGGSNRLISPAGTDIGYGAAFHDTMVEVGKAGQ
jgi:anaerobic selenocysteine-containing dehydrogenase